ncbi:MBL fold metallo-hydrolase [Pontibacter sp. CAU 1760]
MKVTCLTFNPFQENTYLLHDDTKECVVVDPGCYEKQERNQLQHYIEQNNLKVVKLLNTHCHIDHVLGNQFVADTYQVGLEIHPDDEQTLRAVPAYAASYGFPQYAEVLPSAFLEEGDKVKFGETELEVLFTPGHAPGHIVFYHGPSKACIGGDVLFRDSIGRTDLPGGSFETLLHSIRTKLFALPDDVTVYPGHGPETTIGHEKLHNPFLV